MKRGFYKHYKGGMYILLAVTNKDTTRKNYPPQVVYLGVNGKLWSRELSKFTTPEKFKPYTFWQGIEHALRFWLNLK